MSTSTKTNPRKFAYNFVTKNRTAALATVDTNSQPDIATIYCVVDEDLTLYFTSRVEGRKYINLLAHPVVALSLTDESNLAVMLIKGRAERVEQLDLEQQIMHRLLVDEKAKALRTLPSIQLFHNGYTNEVAIIRIVPSEITYANFLGNESNSKPIFQKII